MADRLINSLFEEKEGHRFENGTYSYLLLPEPGVFRHEVFVLVHGIGHWSFAWKNWESLLLAKGYAVLVYDLIGRGHSDWGPEGRFALGEHLDQLHSLMIPLVERQETTTRYSFGHGEEVSVDTFTAIHLIGHSQGGAIVLGYASNWFEDEAYTLKGKLQSIIMLAPAGLSSNIKLDLLQYSGCVQYFQKNTLMQMETQRAAWVLEYIDKELGKKNAEYLEAMHAISERSAMVTEAIWRTLINFPLTSMQREASQLAQYCRLGTLPRAASSSGEAGAGAGAGAGTGTGTGIGVAGRRKCKVGLIWGDKDITVPYSNIEHFTKFFMGRSFIPESDDVMFCSDNGYFCVQRMNGIGHELTNERTEDVFAHVMDMHTKWEELNAPPKQLEQKQPQKPQRQVNMEDVKVETVEVSTKQGLQQEVFIETPPPTKSRK